MSDELLPGERPKCFEPPTSPAAAPAGPMQAGPVVIDDIPTPFDEELIAEDPSAPSPGILNRYREIARRAARGERNCDIAAALGYTQSRISIVMKDPFVQAEITRQRDALMETDAMSRLRLVAPDAVERIHAAVLDKRERGGLDAAKFVLEMTHGKPRQSVAVESSSLGAFTELLRQMHSRGEVIDVSPREAGPMSGVEIQRSDSQHQKHQEDQGFDAWLSTNLPAPIP